MEETPTMPGITIGEHYPPLDIGDQEDDLMRTKKQRWNRSLEEAVKVLSSPSGLDAPPTGPATRGAEKSSYEKALEAYDDLRKFLQDQEESTESLDTTMAKLGKLNDETTSRLQEAERTLRKELEKTKRRNSKAGSRRSRAGSRRTKSRSSSLTYSYDSQGERIHDTLRSHLRVLVSVEEAAETEKLEQVEDQKRKLEEEVKLVDKKLAEEEDKLEKEKKEMEELIQQEKREHEERQKKEDLELQKRREQEDEERRFKEEREKLEEAERRRQEALDLRQLREQEDKKRLEEQKKELEVLKATQQEREQRLMAIRKEQEERRQFLEQERSKREARLRLESLRIRNASKINQAQLEKDIHLKMAQDWEGAIEDLLELSPLEKSKPYTTIARPDKEATNAGLSNAYVADRPIKEERDYASLYDQILSRQNPYDRVGRQPEPHGSCRDQKLQEQRRNEGDNTSDVSSKKADTMNTLNTDELAASRRLKSDVWRMKPTSHTHPEAGTVEKDIAYTSGCNHGRHYEELDELSQFSGDERDFTRFKVEIKRLMNNYADHRRGAELVYNEVKRRCVGRAAQAIIFSRDIVDYGDALSQAMARLEKFFGDSRAVIRKHQRELIRPEVLDGSQESLQDLLIEMERCHVVLQDQGSARLLDNQTTVDGIVTNRFPEDMRSRFLDWCLITGISSASYNELMSFIEREYERCSLPYAKPVEELKGKVKKGLRKDSRMVPRAHNEISEYNSGPDYSTGSAWIPIADRPCIACGKVNQHKPYKCDEFKSWDIKKRWEKVKQHRLCFRCLGWAHPWKKCVGLENRSLDCGKCGFRNHHTLLCDKANKAPGGGRIRGEHDASSNAPQEGGRSYNVDTSNKCYLPILKIKAIAPSTGKQVILNALIDSGASDTISTFEVADSLGLSGAMYESTLRGATGAVTTVFFQIDFDVQNINTGQKYSLKGVRCFPKMDWRHGNPIRETVDWRQYRHLEGISIDPPDSSKIDIIIGQDHGWLLDELEIRRGEKGPTAKLCRLGWYLAGPQCWPTMGHQSPTSRGTSEAMYLSSITGGIGCRSVDVATAVCSGDPDNCPLLRAEISRAIKGDYEWSQEDDEVDLSIEDKRAMKILDQSIRVAEDGHWKMKLPVREEINELPNNKEQAAKRLEQVKRMAKRDPETWEFYRETMSKLKVNHLERVVDEDREGPIWYIPTFCTKQAKPRLVQDAKAKYKGYCLNDCLLPGPNTMKSLTDILMRFRQGQFAFSCDIKEQFLQIRVDEKDRDLLRVLWFEDDDPDNNIVEYRFKDLPFGLVSSPLMAGKALLETAKENAAKVDVRTILVLLNNFYVDDGLDSEDTEEDAIKVAVELVKLLDIRGFNLRKFVSNSKRLLEVLGKERVIPELQEVDLDQTELPEHKVLGVQWNSETDQLVVKVNIPQRPFTKRGLFSVLARIFDPLGFCQPYLLTGRHILQEACMEMAGWDEDLSDALVKRWKRWMDGLPALEELKLNRCYTHGGRADLYSLHTFSDASLLGKGCVTYVVGHFKDHRQVSFVTGKAKTVPKGCTTTVPKLELLAADMAAQQHYRVKNALELAWSSCYLWTDSTAVKMWLESTQGRFKKFVTRRLEAIRRYTMGDSWRYVNTKYNPADLASRGMYPSTATVDSLWIQGPPFLYEPEEAWPMIEDNYMSTLLARSITSPEVEEDSDEASCCEEHWETEQVSKPAASTPPKCYMEITHTYVEVPKSVKELIEKSTDLNKICRLLAIRRRFVIFKCNRQLNKDWVLERGQITSGEIEVSKRVILQSAQEDVFGLENLTSIQRVGFNKALGQATPEYKRELRRIAALSPYMDKQGLLRVGGRLHRSMLPYESVFPMIMPKRHRVTKLIVQQQHQDIGHLGHGCVLAKLMQKYWVVHGTCSVKYYIKDCLFCKIRRGKSCEQLMAPLPAARVRQMRYCFESVGVDLFGPLHAKRGRCIVKRYGAIITCMASRAVHIEVVEDISTNAFIMAFWRFSNRRGQCTREVFSDNGTNFHGMDNLCKDLLKKLEKRLQGEGEERRSLHNALNEEAQQKVKELDQERITAVLARKGIAIHWNYNSPDASHQGGVYERCIRSIRYVMAALVHEGLSGLPPLKHRTPTDIELESILIEVEAILNSRPITRLSDNPDDAGALTPQMLLSGVLDPTTPLNRFCKADEYRASWKFTQAVAERFWERWVKMYLPWLQVRQKWLNQERNLKKGDLVLVLGLDNEGRWNFPKAIVIDVYPDEFGMVRNVKIKVASGQQYKRDVRKLVLLEAFGDENSDGTVVGHEKE